MPLAADLADKLQAEDTVRKRERFKLRARRHAVVGLHAVQDSQGRDRVEVIIEGDADLPRGFSGNRPGRLTGPLRHLVPPSAERLSGVGQHGLGELHRLAV